MARLIKMLSYTVRRWLLYAGGANWAADCYGYGQTDLETLSDWY